MKYSKKLLFFLSALFFARSASGQSEFKGLENLFTPPANYVVYHTVHPPVIDGNINELVWQQTNWTDEFVDIEGDNKPKPAYPTKVKMLWDDSCLYIAAKITEPQVWATLKEHDDIIFHDNDFEFFIDPANAGQPYFEVEVNALNTIFDLLLNKPYRDGGSPIVGWDATGLRSAVKIQGTLNNPGDTDEGWTVEIALPFKSINVNIRSQMPEDGAVWRINFSRVEWDTKVVDGKYVKLTNDKGQPLPEHNWVWSPQGAINMHYPERWGYLQFSRKEANTVTFNLPYPEEQKQYLWLIYYREKQWYARHHSYALSLADLGVTERVHVGAKENNLKLEATHYQFTGLITDDRGKTVLSINESGLIQHITEHPNE